MSDNLLAIQIIADRKNKAKQKVSMLVVASPVSRNFIQLGVSRAISA